MFDSHLVNIVWCGSSQVVAEDLTKVDVDTEEKSKKLFFLTDKGNIYMSKDDGFSIKNVTSQLE